MIAVLWPVRGLYFSADDFEWLLAARQAVARGFLSLPADVNGHFRPLVDLVWRLEYQAFGLSASSYHLFAVVLHALVSLLVALTARRLTGDVRGGLVAGLVFGVSLTHRGAVTWCSAVPDLWVGFLGALALLLALGPRPRPALSLMVAGLAGLAKETGLIVPAMLLLCAPRVFTSLRLRLAGAALVLVLLAAHASAVVQSPYVRGRFVVGPHMVPRAGEAVAALLFPVGLLPADSLLAIVAAVAGIAAVIATAAFAATTPGWRQALRWMAAAGLALFPALFANTPIESRWLYLPAVVFAPLVAAAVIALSDAAVSRFGPIAGRIVVPAVVIVHVITHGFGMRVKISRAAEREIWVRALVEGAKLHPPPIEDGDTVEVRVPFGSELRFWPLGVMLALDRKIEIRPIDDRSEPTPGLHLYDAAISPPKWRR